ncbi:hypothetical protein MVEN_01725400 [Mycena venus]|uniref:Integrase catalytic domain-containing protein n=1 Tax=Mycena venus TaxID=2733690 RepID=A0A8H7CM92_9AGAR|nr:hypothetical protein MVEN_01725400 [Mycena venus]
MMSLTSSLSDCGSTIEGQGSPCSRECFVDWGTMSSENDIRCRTYNVPGPNSLWHHDGQHALIRWCIVIHGFIDGYSRLITGLLASNNNRAQTVLDLFLLATAIYGVLSRVRGDHGVENLLVAAWMEAYHGEG